MFLIWIRILPKAKRACNLTSNWVRAYRELTENGGMKHRQEEFQSCHRMIAMSRVKITLVCTQYVKRLKRTMILFCPDVALRFSDYRITTSMSDIAPNVVSLIVYSVMNSIRCRLLMLGWNRSDMRWSINVNIVRWHSQFHRVPLLFPLLHRYSRVEVLVFLQISFSSAKSFHWP